MDDLKISVDKCQVMHTGKIANDACKVMVSHTGQEIFYVVVNDFLKMSTQVVLTVLMANRMFSFIRKGIKELN